MESKFTDIGTQKLHYLIGGEGKTIVIIPSFGITSRTYDQLGKLLLKHYRVIILDIYKGKSEFNINPVNIAEYSEELRKFINLIEIKEFYLIGFSSGGLIVTDFLIRYPRISMKVMLFSTSVTYVNIRYKLFRFVYGYLKLTFHYLRSVPRIKFEILCLSDAFGSYIKHKKLFFSELSAVLNYIPGKMYQFYIPVKLIFALKDEYLDRKILEKNKKVDSLEIEIVNDDHAWFFIKNDLFVKKVREYFG